MSITLDGDDPKIYFKNGTVQDTSAFGPMFSAYLAANRSLNSATFTPLLADSVQVDTHGFYNPATGFFQPTIPGWYEIAYGVSFVSTTMTTALVCLNSASGLLTVGQHIDAYISRLSTARCIQFNGSNDKVAAVTYAVGSNIVIQGGLDTFFQAHFVRPL